MLRIFFEAVSRGKSRGTGRRRTHPCSDTLPSPDAVTKQIALLCTPELSQVPCAHRCSRVLRKNRERLSHLSKRSLRHGGEMLRPKAFSRGHDRWPPSKGRGQCRIWCTSHIPLASEMSPEAFQAAPDRLPQSAQLTRQSHSALI